MKTHTASLINALVLILFSSWGYFSSETPSITAFIPAILGLILIVCNKGIKNENKVIAHVAVLITLVALLGLFKPLLGAIERQNTAAIFRIGVMIITTIWAFVYFIKSFREARKNREKKEIEN